MLQEKSLKTTDNGMFATVANGMIIRRSDETNPKAIKRINKLNNTVYELQYEACTGYITNIQFGTQLFITISDGESVLNIDIKNDSAYGRSMWKQLFNINYDEPVRFKPYSFKDKETHKDVIGISITQDGGKVEKETGMGALGEELDGVWCPDKLAEAKRMKTLAARLNKLCSDRGWIRTIKDADADEKETKDILSKNEEQERKDMLKNAKNSNNKNKTKNKEENGMDEFFNDFN